MSCSTDMAELIQGPPPVSRIVMRRPRLRMIRTAEGKWSTEKLLPLPDATGDWPSSVVMEGVILEIIDPQKTPPSTLTLRDGDLHFELLSESPPGFEEDEYVYQVRGSFRGDHLRKAEFQGLMGSHGEKWNFTGSAEALEICPELQEALPPPWRSRLGALEGFRAQAGLRFKIDHDAGQAEPDRFEVTSRVVQGHSASPLLPFPLNDVEARIVCNNQGVTVHELTASSGEASFQLNGHWKGLSLGGPCSFQFTGDAMTLDRKLLQYLPAGAQQAWDRFSPSGRFDVNVRADFDGAQWKPDVNLTLRDVAFTSRDFPYPLRNAQGWIRLKEDQLETDLTAYMGAEPLRIRSSANVADLEAASSLTIRGADLKLDEPFLAALPSGAGKVSRNTFPAPEGNAAKNGSSNFKSAPRIVSEDAASRSATFAELRIRNG
ncbi:MAG: hypothetical protein N2C14_18375, partial [Planctomycetales bacterium]